MPVSATASSTQSRPSATLRTRRATSPSFVNLQALLSRLSRICLSRMGSAVSAPTFCCASTTRRFWFFSAGCPAVPITSSMSRAKLIGSRLRSSLPASIFERSRTSLMRPSRWVPAGVHPAQRFQRLFRAEARRVGDHHLRQADNGVERRAQLVAHAGEELRLVLARQLQLAVLVLDFIEQAHILDGNHRLVRKYLDQLDLLVGKRPDDSAV